MTIDATNVNPAVAPTVPGNSDASRDVASYLHPYTNHATHEQTGPHIITGGDGIYVTDDSGHKLIEGMAGLWCTSLGFSEKRLVDAATKQLNILPYYHTFASKSTNPAIDLAEKLLEIAPVPMSKVFFANSGSEATDSAVKMVWYYHNAIGQPEKKKIISRKKGYHGVTVAAASMTGLPGNHKLFDLPIDRILHTETPHYWRDALPGEEEEDFATRLAEQLEDLIQAEGPETVGAFIAEPIMGAGGVIVPPRTYFEKIQEVLKRYDILFIADEVICGFGRTGRMFASETFRLKPDMITVAKQLSSAYLPISALFINEAIYQAVKKGSDEVGTFGHGFTYSGHPVAAAVALETLKIYEDDGIIEHVRSVMSPFQKRLKDLNKFDHVGETRGHGLIGAFELVSDKCAKTPFDPYGAAGKAVAAKCLEHGVILRALGDTVAFCPPLIITEDQIHTMFDAVEAALTEWHSSL
ncbi:aspartate aminotransferase family protein [Thalassospira lucentensis]|jgi:4-aminobutyrate---pyruvate transaminase|uniref:aspartate aminotransferase family protein n=1 Tax=Thalassospira lucentensis TaxID=168935 RepID=UPI0003B45592|nr:aspartate aminotransferase family protein [Thalassospira lucentensis]RCK24679.1 aminotransferase [Thalassospira lucentensis MCCC 1A00383 = DSM 14000]|tara:strand:+ start:69990 stop:71393 length:1404 start_codon:yes stop_codon:yes gene_type:complete